MRKRNIYLTGSLIYDIPVDQTMAARTAMQLAKSRTELPFVVCCMCGVRMKPNQANTCAQCLQSKFDITEAINKTAVLMRCKACERYQRDTTGWIVCPPESRELLALCLKRITGLKYLKLVDACFLWTEPHSKRLKVRLKVQKEVINGVILEESCVVEFILQSRMCDACHRVESNKTWSSVVQVRQKVAHKRTFLFLEQLIIKHKEYERTIKIESMPDGVDFYFAARNDAVRFVSFLESVVPVRCKTSKHLITADAKSNVALFNHTFCVELVPICKDDLICLPRKVANKLGNICPFVLCTSVSSTIKLIDPRSCQIAELNAEKFWKTEFQPLSSVLHCVEFTVLDVQMERQSQGKSPSAMQSSFGTGRKKGGKKRKAQAESMILGKISKSHGLATIEVARSDDLGVNDRRITVYSHLGNILKPGDSVLGYDLATSNVIDTSELDLNKSIRVPEVVLVKKHFPLWRKSQKKRNWKLQTIGLSETAQGDLSKDREMFMRDIEEDESVRNRVNLYRDPNAGKSNENPEAADPIEEDIPRINMESMLEDFQKATLDAPQ